MAITPVIVAIYVNRHETQTSSLLYPDKVIISNCKLHVISQKAAEKSPEN